MKKLAILSAIALSGLIYSTADAQIGIHVGLRFATPRVGVVVENGPVYEQLAQVNYDGDDDYYYLPDVDAYYSVNEQCYYYFDGDSWISAEYLPGAYREYDWRTARRYEVRAPRPYMHDDIYRSRYNGHAEGVFARGNNDRVQRGYQNNQERYNAPDQRFNNRERGYAPQNNDQRFDNRGQGYSRPAQQDNGQRFDNRAQGGYRQPAQQNSNEQGSYRQSAQPNNGQGRGQGNYGQPSQQPRGGNSQPSNQTSGRDHSNSGGGQHYTQNSPKGGYSARSMTKF